MALRGKKTLLSPPPVFSHLSFHWQAASSRDPSTLIGWGRAAPSSSEQHLVHGVLGIHRSHRTSLYVSVTLEVSPSQQLEGLLYTSAPRRGPSSHDRESLILF